ncbi:hypothetical protein SMSP2_02124 [Limihaloglobus sulfuriphilus]|uniref:F5/8 type C domain-containing protein n=1 Tax=Limihaloglobus sulfuriphilus TaxID=1851148 RepID=A0A1R7T5T6_9BACT|nr:hypothetical protein [Limihaloglobus sulfuriphilus]AQQ71746.1 hypothetical protein SMSP2_02124 [Limihaloglobus sulfuriphilus]
MSIKKNILLAAVFVLTCSLYAYRPVGYEQIEVWASSENNSTVPAVRVIDESGLTDDLHDNHDGGATMWLTVPGAPVSSANTNTETGPAWIAFKFDKPRRLGRMWVWNYNQEGLNWGSTGRGLKNVSIEYTSDNQNWHKLGDYVFNIAPGTAGYSHNTEIDLEEITATELVITAHTTDGCWGDGTIGYGLSEVRFFSLETQASQFYPIDTARGVYPDVTLSWLAGELTGGAEPHAVYFSDNYKAVLEADTSDTTGVFRGFHSQPSYSPGTLEDGKRYYWRVDQYNDSNPESPWKGPVMSFSTGHARYRFDGSMSRETTESFISRAITQGDFCRPVNEEAFEENKRMIGNIGAKFICRAAIAWDVPHSPTDFHMADDDYYYETIAGYAAKMQAQDHEALIQGTIFETTYSAYSAETPDRVAMGYSGAGVEQIPIPAWVFEEFELPVEQRNFSYEDMLYPDGSFRNHWLPGASIPDITRLETKMWFYYRGRRYIDAGFESIHFGQVLAMAHNDPDYSSWYDVLGRLREYASQHARRGFILCDSHARDGIVQGGEHLMDINLFPLRPKEDCSEEYNATLEFDHIDSIYGKSKAGMTPSGWYCDALPYNVEFDNSGASNPGVCGGDETHWPWGWDEISWFAHCDNDYRNYWIEYAVDWLKANDAVGYVRMPGHTTIAADPIEKGDGSLIWAYRANMPGTVFPDAFGQEQTIKKIWANMDTSTMPGIQVEQSQYQIENYPWPQTQADDTLQSAFQAGLADLSVDSMEYGQALNIADSTAQQQGGLGFGFPADNENFVYGDFEIKFNQNYTGSRTLRDITVFTAPTSDGRRFYNLGFSYSTVDEPDVFKSITRVHGLDDSAVPAGSGSVIEIYDGGTGCISNVDTLRITAGIAASLDGGAEKRYCTAFIEVDANMYDRSDINFDDSVDLKDFSTLARDWLYSSVLPLSNSSFELPDVRDGRISSALPEGWNLNGAVKIYDPSDAQWPSLYSPGQTVPHGEQVIYATGGTLTQDSGVLIDTDTTYQLCAGVGVPLTSTGSSSRISLLAVDGEGEVELAAADAVDGLYIMPNPVPLIKGEWVLQSVSWDSAGSEQLVGRELRVSLGGTFVHLDDVKLTAAEKTADIDKSGHVDMLDIELLGQSWLSGGR